MSSLKLGRRLLYSVRFVFVSTFSLQRERAIVDGITNLSKKGCLCKGKSSGRPRLSEENVRRIQEYASQLLERAENLEYRNQLSDAPFTLQAIKTYEVGQSF